MKAILLVLAREIVQEVTQPEYLGVTMTVEGNTHHHCLNRIPKMKKGLNQL